MMYTDPIADLLTRIRNGIHADHDLITVPHSKMKVNIVKILKNTNIIKYFEITV
ncbi:MAG: 30S ribosomal protein S8, partial [Nanoarchaeota archaeon]